MAVLIGIGSVGAKENYLDSYNLKRAYEEGDKGNYTEAVDFFKKEIKEHPRNSWAYLGLAGIYYDQKKYDEAYTAINDAIETAPKKDKHLLSTAYYYKGTVLLATADTVAALNDLEKSISLDPKFWDVYEKRGEIYFNQKKYDLSDNDFSKLIELKPAYERGYMGLGRNAFKRGNYEEALKNYNKVINLYPEYSSGYSFRGETYLAQKEYVKAIDDICKALFIDGDHKAYMLLYDFPKEQENLVIAKLQGVANSKPHSGEYLYYMGQIYKNNKNYTKSIDILKKAYEIDAYPIILKLMADNYSELGDYTEALNRIEESLQIEPDDDEALTKKADILGEAGLIDECIQVWGEIIEKYPDQSWGYYRRAFFEDNDNRTNEALSDYEMAVTMQPDHAYSWLGKADMLMRKGKTEQAMEAYKKVVELDTVPNNESCAMYAWLSLNDTDKAIDYMERVIAQDTTSAGNYYDGACFYSRMGNLDKALENLKISFEKGFRRFHHVMADDDLEALRETSGFQELMEQYTVNNKPIQRINIDENTEDIDNASGGIIEIPFIPEGGCASVKCTINDLPLTFIFDTGASVVSMSQLEANFMLKNGYLNQSDFVGNGRFVNADGEVSENSIINLKNIDFGGLHLTNVKASVVKNQKAPLLLGQTVLGRLGSIEIDNTNKKLIIRK